MRSGTPGSAAPAHRSRRRNIALLSPRLFGEKDIDLPPPSSGQARAGAFLLVARSSAAGASFFSLRASEKEQPRKRLTAPTVFRRNSPSLFSRRYYSNAAFLRDPQLRV
jgi:hypothetical protein